jgi:hypothetical protein
MPHVTHAARRIAGGFVIALAMSVGLTSFTVGTASAAETTSRSVVGKSDLGKISSKVVGRTSEGDRVTGSFTPIKTVNRDGALYMKGFLEGRIKDAGPDTKFSGVKLIPIKKINGQKLIDGRMASNAAACDILNLVLGPLDLNLLGLEINLQRVVLDIVAVPGAGNLLGNLLCAVAGLLDGGPLAGLLGQLQTLLNQILGLLNLGV